MRISSPCPAVVWLALCPTWGPAWRVNFSAVWSMIHVCVRNKCWSNSMRNSERHLLCERVLALRCVVLRRGHRMDARRDGGRDRCRRRPVDSGAQRIGSLLESLQPDNLEALEEMHKLQPPATVKSTRTSSGVFHELIFVGLLWRMIKAFWDNEFKKGRICFGFEARAMKLVFCANQ